MKHYTPVILAILLAHFSIYAEEEQKTEEPKPLSEQYEKFMLKPLPKDDSAEKQKTEQPEAQVEKPAETAAPEPEKTAVPEKKKKNYVSIAVMGNVTVPTGKADATWAVHGKLHYIFPFWNPHLSFGAEAGYYTLKGKGSNIDPQAGLYDYSWKIDTVPLFIGLALDYPMLSPVLFFTAEAGFAMVFAWSEGSSFGGNSSAEDIAYGWYAGVGADARFGVFGGITFEARYTGMLLDFEYPAFNESPGDLGGISFLLGYKIIF